MANKAGKATYISVTAPCRRSSRWGIEVFVHNGHGGPAGWHRAGTVDIAMHEEVWEDRVFDVVDLGTVPNDREILVDEDGCCWSRDAGTTSPPRSFRT